MGGKSVESVEAVELRGRWLKTCEECGGTGSYLMNECGPDLEGAERVTCDVCSGRGRVLVEGWAAVDPGIGKLMFDTKEEDGESTNSN